jgi:hypothetical protein
VAGAGLDRDRGRLFLALSWLGSGSLPPLGRPIGLFVFFVLAVARPCRCSVRWPMRSTAAAARSRKPAAASAGHRDRRPHGAEAGDQFAVALWRAHLERALRAATR